MQNICFTKTNNLKLDVYDSITDFYVYNLYICGLKQVKHILFSMLCLLSLAASDIFVIDLNVHN